jgi:hypothetical protein
MHSNRHTLILGGLLSLCGLCALSACGSATDADFEREAAEADAGSPDAGRALDTDELLAGTICPDPKAPGVQSLSFQLLSVRGGAGILPVRGDDHPVAERTPYAALLGPEALTFALPPGVVALDPDSAGPTEANGVVESGAPQGFTGVGVGRRVGVTLTPVELKYVATGGNARATAPLQVIMLLDHSGSLRGQRDPQLAPDPSRASDLRSAHLELFAQLVRTRRLADDTAFSLVWFQDDRVFVTPEFGAASTERTRFVCPDDAPTCRADPTQDGLARLAVGQAGGTPLTDALDTTFDEVVAPGLDAGRNPVVVLFTDGVENGDTSAVPERLPLVVGRYVEAGVPLAVVHLEPASPSADPRGPAPEFHALACATGGQYLYVARPEDFAERDLRSRLLGALFGAWQARMTLVTADTPAPGPALLTTHLSLAIGGGALDATLAAPAIPGAPDTRLLVALERLQ